MNRDAIITHIFETFRRRGQQMYSGEPVSMTEHMLQTAQAAEQNGASPTLIAAAILHDYGHLMHDLPEDCADHGIDDKHEEMGAAFLEQYFVAAVTEPVRLHVAAKRYLCAVDPDYFDALSPASLQSLALQGGPFSSEEARAFEAVPYSVDAVQLRQYDELAKVPGASTPDLEYYRPYIEAGLKQD